jgi:hypothetical protein
VWTPGISVQGNLFSMGSPVIHPLSGSGPTPSRAGEGSTNARAPDEGPVHERAGAALLGGLLTAPPHWMDVLGRGHTFTD